MRVVIVGGGAIGRLFGGILGQGGNEITFVDVDPRVVEALKSNGVGVLRMSPEGEESMLRVPVSAVHDGREITGCDLVLLTVKSFATSQAAKAVAHLVTTESPIVFMQTGLGNQSILREMFPVKAILAGLTFMSGTALGFSRVRKGRCGLTFLGELGEVGELTGEVTPRLKELADMFNSCGIETRWSHKIIERLWAKVIVYATLNTLTSVLRVPNGMLLRQPESVLLVRQMLAEGAQVAQARGVDPIVDDLFELFEEVVQESGDNLSSMLQDILNGRPTEIEAQSGAIARYAETFGLQVPRHQTMASLLRLLEAWPVER